MKAYKIKIHHNEDVKVFTEEQRYIEYDKGWINRMIKSIKYKKIECDKLNSKL